MTRAIVICGTMGSGKSSVLRALMERIPQCQPLREDDFNPAPLNSIEEIQAWMRRGGHVGEFDLSSLVLELKRAKPDSIVLLESQFGRLHPQLRPHISLQFWIDVPIDVAFARKVSQLSREMCADPAAQSSIGPLQWLAGFCDSYLAVTRDLFMHQRQTVAAQSDHEVSGEAAPERVAAAILKLVEGRPR